MKKYFIFIMLMFCNVVLFSEDVELTIYLGLNKGVETLVVDENIEQLWFGKPSYIKTLSGLEKLKKLKLIRFERTGFLEDVSFLKKCPSLETVVIYNAPSLKNFDFVKTLPNLKILIISSCRLDDIQIDFKNNKKLEYIDLSRNNIRSLSKIKNIPDSCKYINFIYNKELDKIDLNVLKSAVIFCKGCKIKEITKQLNFDWPSKVLPEYINKIMKGVI